MKTNTPLKKHLKNIVSAILLLMMVNPIVAFAEVLSSEKDTAMMLKVKGEIIINNDKKNPAIGYVKLKKNDKIVMNPNSYLQLVYLTSGQIETWANNRVFKVGDDSSVPVEGKPENINKLPASVVKQFEVISMNVESFERVGMVRIRNANKLKTLSAEKTYARIKKEQDKNSTYAEEFLASNYYEAGEDQKLLEFLAEISSERPDNPDIEAITKKYLSLLNSNNTK